MTASAWERRLPEHRKCFRPVIRRRSLAAELRRKSTYSRNTEPGRQQVSHFRLQLLHLFTGTLRLCARQPCENALAAVRVLAADHLKETLKTNSS